MESVVGSLVRVMDWATSTNRCNLLRSWTELFSNQVWCDQTVSFPERIGRSLKDSWQTCQISSATLRKIGVGVSSCCCINMVVQDWSLKILMLWNLKFSTLSTSAPLMLIGSCTSPCFLKLITSSFVLLTLRRRLLVWHHVTKLSLLVIVRSAFTTDWISYTNIFAISIGLTLGILQHEMQ